MLPFQKTTAATRWLLCRGRRFRLISPKADYKDPRRPNGDAMISKRLYRGLGGSQILACLVGFLASLVPSLVYTDPFWGISAFSNTELFATSEPKGVVVLQVESGSPAAALGLQKGDQIVTVNGKQANVGNLRQLFEGIQPSESVNVNVSRSGRVVRLTAAADTPRLEGVLFMDWQFVSAPVFLVLLLLLIATQPLAPAPFWRSTVVLVGGLAVLTVAIVIELKNWMPWSWVWESKPISHAPPPVLHYSLLATVFLAGLALTFLGAFAIRARLAGVSDRSNHFENRNSI